MYTPFKIKTHFSFLESIIKPSDLADRLEELKIDACAITDNNLCGCVQFIQKCKNKNIKPILGMTVHENADHDIIILAKNFQGWQDLLLIHNRIHSRKVSFLSKEEFDELVTENLIIIVGHFGSYIYDCLIDNNIDLSKERLSLYCKSPAEVYIGVQRVKHADKLRDLGHEFSIPCIALTDSHYLDRGDCDDQRILISKKYKTTLDNVHNKFNRADSRFYITNTYNVPSRSDLEQWNTEEEIENTLKLSDRCEEYNIFRQPSLPKFPCPNGLTEKEYLKELCWEGWKYRNIDRDNQVYIDRVKEELDTFALADLEGYFLINIDLVKFLESKGCLVSFRGSAGGCLVSYLIGITDIDPIKENLIFSRFFNSGRLSEGHISYPDIDLDIPKYYRELAIQYVTEKYGEENVAQMATFTTMKGRGALTDVMSTLGSASFDDIKKITKYIPDEAKIADDLQDMKDEFGDSSIIQWALENRSKQLQEWCRIGEDNKLEGPYASQFEQAIRLEGTITNASKHAAGVVISPKAIQTICPLIFDKNTKLANIAIPMSDAELLGMVKNDFLGVVTLDKLMDMKEQLLHFFED